jgi:hypothetical protein
LPHPVPLKRIQRAETASVGRRLRRSRRYNRQHPGDEEDEGATYSFPGCPGNPVSMSNSACHKTVLFAANTCLRFIKGFHFAFLRWNLWVHLGRVAGMIR